MTRNLSHRRDFTEETWRALADENWLGRTTRRQPFGDLPDNTVEVTLHDDGEVTVLLLPGRCMWRRAATVDEAFKGMGL